MKTASGYIAEFYELGQVVIPDDSVFKEVAETLNIFKRHKGHYINDISVSRLGCGMTRIYL